MRNVAGDATIVTGRRVADRYRLDRAARRRRLERRRRDARSATSSCTSSGPTPTPTPRPTSPPKRASLARLNHRNIVATYDTGVDGDGTSYRVDELAGGAPLDLTAVADQRRLAYAVQIARAIADAHDRGLIHGALTSSSVLVDDEGRVQVRGLRLPPPDDDARRRPTQIDIRRAHESHRRAWRRPRRRRCATSPSAGAPMPHRAPPAVLRRARSHTRRRRRRRSPSRHGLRRPPESPPSQAVAAGANC